MDDDAAAVCGGFVVAQALRPALQVGRVTQTPIQQIKQHQRCGQVNRQRVDHVHSDQQDSRHRARTGEYNIHPGFTLPRDAGLAGRADRATMAV